MKSTILEANQPPSLDAALAELAITRQERDDAEGMAASAHHDKKLLEAQLKDRRRQHNEAWEFENAALLSTFHGYITDSRGYTPADSKEAVASLRLVQIGEFMAQPDENVPWLVDNAIAPGTLNGFAGAPKVGKSVSCLSVTLRLGRHMFLVRS